MHATDLGQALHDAARRLRQELGDPTASLALIVPASTNGVLARQALQRAGAFIRIRALTPEQLLSGLSRLTLAQQGLRPPPPGWLELTLTRRLPHLGLPDDLGTTLSQPGWIPALASTLTRLERAGITPQALDQAPASSNRELLRAVLADVATQRADAGYAGPPQVLAAARQALASPTKTPVERMRGAILLGDRVLPTDCFRVLCDWLAERPTELVLPAPLDALEPAERGLRRAAEHAPTTVVSPDANTALARVRRRLWRTPDGAAAPRDDSVILARTPDEQREINEAVRVIRATIRDRGTPLDRIALVVPDAAQAQVVRETLRRASLPATLLVGPPVTAGPSGSFLRLALDLAGGQDDVATWHALLTTPALRLGRALGEGATTGRGRWRRLLSECGASRDVDRMRQGLARQLEQVEQARDPEGDRAALRALDAALSALGQALADLRTPRSLGGFARACAAFLERWGARSQEGVMLQAFLKSLGVGGPAVPLGLARQELLRLLDATPQLEGTLSDRAIVVAMPMALLGGSFDLVCVTGLSHGRLPRKLRPDALLPDPLIHALRASGHPLLPSTALAAREPRRLGAALGAAEQALWLSTPAYEMMEGRPSLSSALLLDVASALEGRRVGFAELEARLVRAGSRHRAFAGKHEHDQALSLAEHRTARAWDVPEQALPWLLAHPAVLRVVLQHLHAQDPTPSAWTGLVPAGLVELPGQDHPTSARSLQRLLASPQEFFLRHVLGAWPPRRLPGPVDVFGDLNLHLLGAIRRAVAQGTLDADGLLAAWEDEVREQQPLDPLDADELDLGRRLAARQAAPLLDQGLPHAESPELDDAEVMGWRISGRRGFTAPGELQELLLARTPSARKAVEERIASFIHAVAEGRPDSDQVHFRSIRGGQVQVPVGEGRAAVLAHLGAATRIAQAGWWTSDPPVEAVQHLPPDPHAGPAAADGETP